MKKTIITIVIIILVLGVGVTLYYHDTKKSSHSAQHEMQQSSSLKPTYAAPGQLVDSFPKALVLSAAAIPISSYTISYSNAVQSTAVYETADSMKTVYAQYLAYFQTNKYEILNKSESASVDSIYAITGSSASGNPVSDVNVLIVTYGSKTKVTTSYLKK